MRLWDWWLGGLALAALPLVHWWLVGRGLAVSGRMTALVDRLRFGPEPPEPELDQAALLEAMRAETVAAFGAEALEEEPAVLPPSLAPEPAAPVPRSTLDHVMFLGGLALGGTASAAAAGALEPMAGLRGEHFAALLEALRVPAPVWLLVGGMLVGFGTRMAGGCTSGHGLCGVSRVQPGSLVATAAFFGAGILTSFLLGTWL